MNDKDTIGHVSKFSIKLTKDKLMKETILNNKNDSILRNIT